MTTWKKLQQIYDSYIKYLIYQKKYTISPRGEKKDKHMTKNSLKKGECVINLFFFYQPLL